LVVYRFKDLTAKKRKHLTRGYFFLFWWNIGWGGGIKNGPKITIDEYFFVEIEKKILKNQIEIAREGCKLKTNLKFEQNSNKKLT